MRGWLSAFLGYLLLSLALQLWAGGWRSDLAGDPDEAAHAVTSLLIRDYALHGLPQSPLAFAEQYYEAWPKIALGHYPPGYYLPNALFLCMDASQESLFAAQAMWASLLGCIVFAIGRTTLGNVKAVSLGAAMLAMPITVKIGSHVMADLQLITLSLAAVWAWRRYLERASTRDSLMFGFLATAAILTKGSALFLALVPPVATVLSGRWTLLKHLSWWLACLPVVLFALPWMLFSVRFTQEGMVKQAPTEYLMEAIPFYADAITWTLGTPWLLLLIGAFVALTYHLVRFKPLPSTDSVLWALIVGTVAIVLLVPTGFSSRYLLPITAASLLLGSFFLASVLERYRSLNRLQATAFLAVIGICLGFAYARPSIVKTADGFAKAIAEVNLSSANDSPQSTNWLVSSDPRGEGALIAAAAFAEPERWQSQKHVLRATKSLVTTDWNVVDYELVASSPDEVSKLLNKLSVGWVFLDQSAWDAPPSHHSLLQTALNDPTSGWDHWKTVPVQRSVTLSKETHIDIYRRRQASRTP